ncbi:hypothetical protein U9M48_002250 [Paspalum notatum var. saurae]|uniref:Uncharacterized protein n=1 Tax=Paspalum notatum var. saurae TaxID=547442 RepID=A0AAQ3PQ43_PASNO
MADLDWDWDWTMSCLCAVMYSFRPKILMVYLDFHTGDKHFGTEDGGHVLQGRRASLLFPVPRLAVAGLLQVRCHLTCLRSHQARSSISLSSRWPKKRPARQGEDRGRHGDPRHSSCRGRGASTQAGPTATATNKATSPPPPPSVFIPRAFVSPPPSVVVSGYSPSLRCPRRLPSPSPLVSDSPLPLPPN